WEYVQRRLYRVDPSGARHAAQPARRLPGAGTSLRAMARLLPPEQWFATLPTAYLTASGLITDTGGRVLLVDPNYREHWTLPGGVVEHAEAPHTACEREVAEEVGLEVRSEEHTSELQSRENLVCRLLLEKK